MALSIKNPKAENLARKLAGVDAVVPHVAGGAEEEQPTLVMWQPRVGKQLPRQSPTLWKKDWNASAVVPPHPT